jgi:hypothetical protein
MPRPEERERDDVVRMLRLDRVLPVTELPVVTPVRPLGALLAADAGAGRLPALGRDAGGEPQVEQ